VEPEAAAAFDQLPLASLVFAADSSVVAANRAWADLSGMTRDDSRGDGWLAAIEPLDRDGLRIRLRSAAWPAMAGSADWRMTGPHGRRWSRWWWKPGGPGAAGALVACVAGIDDDKAHESGLWRRARRDPFTRLVDRDQFVTMANWALRQRHRTGELVAVVVVDVGGFRDGDGNGNRDGHQHAAERASREAARRMLAAVGPADITAQVGSDEFAVLCRDLRDGDEAGEVAGRLRYAARRPADGDGMLRPIPAVVGTAVASRRGDTAETLLSMARAAVRETDRAGPANPAIRDADAVTELAALAVQRISGVALTLAAAISLSEGEAAARAERAADQLDDVIREIRLTAFQLRSSPAPP
jgi:diguanylate cyclase (GGDEF)-like protein